MLRLLRRLNRLALCFRFGISRTVVLVAFTGMYLIFWISFELRVDRLISGNSSYHLPANNPDLTLSTIIQRPISPSLW
jgi:hypothetical protein